MWLAWALVCVVLYIGIHRSAGQFLARWTLIYAVILAAYTEICVYAVNIPRSAVISTYLLTGITQHTVHRIGHFRLASSLTSRLNAWYRAHVVGHHSIYPITRLTTPSYVDNVIDTYKLNTWLYVVTEIVLLSRQASMCEQWVHVLCLIIMVAVALCWENTVHYQLHINSTWMKYTWFRSLREYHSVHHLPPYSYNHAISALFFDLLMGTLRHPSELATLDIKTRLSLVSHDANLEDTDSEDTDSEDTDSEDIDSEDIDSEDIDSEDIDSEDIDSEDIDSEDINHESIKPKTLLVSQITEQEDVNPSLDVSLGESEMAAEWLLRYGPVFEF